MEKRILFVSLALVFLLTAFAPASASAWSKIGKFHASGNITDITEGEVRYLGPPITSPETPPPPDGWYHVVKRDIYGNMTGDVSGELIATYEAMTLLWSTFDPPILQVGIFKGMLVVANSNGETYGFDLKGKTNPVEICGLIPGTEIPYFCMTIQGRWELLQGDKGRGTFDIWLKVILDPEGHITNIVDSSFTMNGWYVSDDD